MDKSVGKVLHTYISLTFSVNFKLLNSGASGIRTHDWMAALQAPTEVRVDRLLGEWTLCDALEVMRNFWKLRDRNTIAFQPAADRIQIRIADGV